MFQPIEVSDMYYNRKYKIETEYGVYSGIYKGKIWHEQLYLEFEIPNCSFKYFLPTRNFYQFVSQKKRIQSDMERRAVNTIMRNLIGDECFTW